MNTSSILAEIDKQIERLQSAKSLLQPGQTKTAISAKRRGRPPMTEAQRKERSSAMKKAWADKKAEA
jgi:hypothetical protein